LDTQKEVQTQDCKYAVRVGHYCVEHRTVDYKNMASQRGLGLNGIEK
jgi:hypothetical protein